MNCKILILRKECGKAQFKNAGKLLTVNFKIKLQLNAFGIGTYCKSRYVNEISRDLAKLSLA